MRAAHEGLSLVFDFQDAGLYFLSVSEGIIDTNTNVLIQSFFTAIQDGKYSGMDSKPVTSKELDNELLSLIKSDPFREKFGTDEIELHPSTDEAGDATVRYRLKGVDIPDENPSFHELYRLVCAINDLLSGANQVYGFVFDAARLDEKMIARVEILLMAFLSRIRTAGHIVYFLFYDTPSRDFARRVLYHSTELHRIGRITLKGAVPLKPAKECLKQLRTTLQSALRMKSPIVFFLGAGTSVGGGMPSGTAILEYALKEVLDSGYVDRISAIAKFREMAHLPISDSAQLTSEHVISYMTKDNTDYLSFDTFVWLNNRNETSAPTEFHESLIGYCLMQGHALILTTNFDTLLERSKGDSVEAIFKDEDFQTLGQKNRAQILESFRESHKVGVLKVHGSLEQPRTITMKWEHLEVLLPGKSKLWESFFEREQTQPPIPVVAVGYGFHDPDLLPKLKGLGERGFKLIAITPEPTIEMCSSIGQRAPQEGAEAMIVNLDCEMVQRCLADVLKEARS